jgi:hypothetical protein
MNEVVVTGLTVDMLRSPIRLSNTASGARHMAWHILRELRAPYQSIGGFFSRDHSSVFYGARAMDGMIEIYPDLKWLYLATKKRCGLYEGEMPEKPTWITFVTKTGRGRGTKLSEKIREESPAKVSDWTDEQKAERKKLCRTFAKITTSDGYMSQSMSPEY